MKNVLILSSSYGEGHQQVAKAIAEKIKAQDQSCNPIIIDFIAWSHPLLFRTIQHFYLNSVKLFPSLYGYVFQKTRYSNSSSKRLNWLISSEMDRMLQLIKEVKPTLIVSTFPYPEAILSRLKELNLINIPTITSLTDYTDHSSWINQFTDHYLVGSHSVRKNLQKKGVPLSKITVSGIPVKSEFLQQYSVEELQVKHGIDPKIPTLLLMGGGCGLFGQNLKILDKIEEIETSLQIIIVCGHNQKLFHRLKKRIVNSKHRIILKKYVTYVNELMAISDLLITKPGGVTSSEAIAMDLPMLLIDPLPGQEEDNASFLTEAGIAILATCHDDLKPTLNELITNKEKLILMQMKAKQLKSSLVSLDILKRYLQLGTMRSIEQRLYDNQGEMVVYAK